MSKEWDFAKEMENWSPPEKFLAQQVMEINRQVREINSRCAVCLPRVESHEITLSMLDTKVKAHDAQFKGLKVTKRGGTLTSGGIAAAVAAGIIAAWEWIARRG